MDDKRKIAKWEIERSKKKGQGTKINLEAQNWIKLVTPGKVVGVQKGKREKSFTSMAVIC